VARGQPTVRRPGVTPRRQRLALGIGEAPDVAVTLALPVGLQVRPPAIAQVRPQVLERGLGVDVAVENADARFGAALGLPHFHVHGASSFLVSPRFFSRAYVASGLSTSILRRNPLGMAGGMVSSPSNCQCGKSEA